MLLVSKKLMEVIISAIYLKESAITPATRMLLDFSNIIVAMVKIINISLKKCLILKVPRIILFIKKSGMKSKANR